MSKALKVILVIIVIIATIPLAGSALNYFTKDKIEEFGFENKQIEELLKMKDLNLSEAKPNTTKPEETENPEQEYKEFMTENGNLRLDYPSNWFRLEGKYLERFQEKINDYGYDTLFMAVRLDIDKFAQLIVQQGPLDQDGLEGTIEMMKTANKEQGWNMNISSLEIENNEANFEAIYSKEGRQDTHSKERLVLTNENKIVLMAFIAFDKDWPEFQEKAQFIIESATID